MSDTQMFIRVKAFLMISVLFTLMGCGGKVYSPDEYVQWATNTKNGLRREVKLERQQYDLQYVTAELMAQKIPDCIKGTGNCDSIVATIKKEKLHRFQLRLKTEGMDDIFDAFAQEEYAAKVTHASFAMRNDFSLIEGSDTIAPVFFHSERSFGISPYTVFLIHFEAGENPTDELILVYEDKLFNNGRVIFRTKNPSEQKIKWNNKS